MEKHGNRHEKSDSVNNDKKIQISSNLVTFSLSSPLLLNMRILSCPLHRHKGAHKKGTCMNTQDPYQQFCQTHTKSCHDPPLSLTHIHTHTHFPSEEWNFHIFLGDPGKWLSKNTWSGHPLFSDGKICFLIQSSLLPPGSAMARQIPAVWLQNLTELKNSLITIPS